MNPKIRQTLEKNKSISEKATDLISDVLVKTPKGKSKIDVLAKLTDEQSKQLIVGGDGFYTFYPDSIKNNAIEPLVYITEIKIFNNKLNRDTALFIHKSLILSHDQNFITFNLISPTLFSSYFLVADNSS